jgi:hypothetical protein
MNAERPVGGADFTAKDKLDEKQVALQIIDLTGYVKSVQAK